LHDSSSGLADPARLDLAAPGRNATAVIRKDFDEITQALVARQKANSNSAL